MKVLKKGMKVETLSTSITLEVPILSENSPQDQVQSMGTNSSCTVSSRCITDVAITPSPTSAFHNPDLNDRQVCCHVLKDAHIPNVAPTKTGQTMAAELFPCPPCQKSLGHF